MEKSGRRDGASWCTISLLSKLFGKTFDKNVLEKAKPKPTERELILEVNLMEKLYEKSETGCCNRFDPAPWDEKELKWKNKLFVKDHVISFLHIPLNFGSVVVKNMEKIKAAGALGEQLMLSDENSLFGSDVYIAVEKEVPDAKMEKITGTFLSKAYEGGYQNMENWVKDMEKYAKAKNKKIEKMYFFYTMCPSCAKAYGQNYTVILAKV